MVSSPSAKTTDRGWLLGGYSGGLLVSVWSLFVTGVTGRLLLPPLLPTIISEFAISLSAAGVALTVLEAGRGITLYPSGHFSDQLSRSTLIVPGCIGMIAGFVLIAVAPVYVALIVGAALLGLGEGSSSIAARALVADHFVERRGRALGFFAVGFNVGGVIAPTIASLVTGSWRHTFLVLAGFVTVLTGLFVYWNREPYDVSIPTIDIVEVTKRLVKTPTLRGPLVAFTLFFMVTASFLGFFPTFLREVKGFSPDAANLGFALVFIIGFSKFGAGALSDRISRKLISIGGLILAAIGLSVIIIASDPIWLWPAIVVFALGHQAQFPLVDAIITDAALDTNIGSDLGAARTLFALVGSLGPTYVGVVSQFYSYTAAFWGLAGCLLISAALLGRQVFR